MVHGLSASEKENLLIPWNTPEKAIKGGAVFIGSKYISTGQNTLYLQKFSVNNNYPQNLYWHQYMTNCLAPYNESSSIYKAYSDNGMLNTSIGFLIPVYNNMPEIMVSSPNISASDFEEDSTLMYANVTTTLNIRCGPGTNYEIVSNIPKNTLLTRIAKGKNGWDKVKLENGLIGYVFATYLKESSSINININESLRVDANQISNLPYEDMSVSNIKKLIQTSLSLSFKDSSGKELADIDKVGTGSTVIFTDSSGNEVTRYVFLLYGDLNGDGLINSLDVLVLQKHILEIKTLEGIFLKAANISKDLSEPSSLDVLKLQKHILEIKFIEQ